MINKAIFNWSGGKDSALALYYTLKNPQFKIETLLTTISASLGRISMHGVRKTMLQKQVELLDLPLSIVSLPEDISMDKYDELMRDTLENLFETGISHAVFGDIFLEDLRRYREERLKEVGLKGYFPLWKRDTKALIAEFLSLGFRTIVVSVDGSKLDQSFVGRELTMDFINDLPSHVDPCGENGEFHTFVFDGPIFQSPVRFSKGEIVGKSYKLSQEDQETVTYWFQDLIPL